MSICPICNGTTHFHGAACESCMSKPGGQWQTTDRPNNAMTRADLMRCAKTCDNIAHAYTLGDAAVDRNNGIELARVLARVCEHIAIEANAWSKTDD